MEPHPLISGSGNYQRPVVDGYGGTGHDNARPFSILDINPCVIDDNG